MLCHPWNLTLYVNNMILTYWAWATHATVAKSDTFFIQNQISLALEGNLLNWSDNVILLSLILNVLTSIENQTLNVNWSYWTWLKSLLTLITILLNVSRFYFLNLAEGSIFKTLFTVFRYINPKPANNIYIICTLKVSSPLTLITRKYEKNFKKVPFDIWHYSISLIHIVNCMFMSL